MKSLETKLTRIGNSRGLRLPAEMIRRYRLEEGVLLEEQENQIVIKGTKADKSLSCLETARQMGAEQEDWAEWDSTVADGLENCPWEHPLPQDAVEWLKKSGASSGAKKHRSKK